MIASSSSAEFTPTVTSTLLCGELRCSLIPYAFFILFAYYKELCFVKRDAKIALVPLEEQFVELKQKNSSLLK
jgi:hypothetical protein